MDWRRGLSSSEYRPKTVIYYGRLIRLPPMIGGIIPSCFRSQLLVNIIDFDNLITGWIQRVNWRRCSPGITNVLAALNWKGVCYL
ncbi:hypothetical protein TNCT_291751 [Trichonephila clavata]|uniref:Uncharacterized protein n=1 Tax=Trichonephila clavata TaxID=2740835 RepID=A0A8X6IPS9_TRICU|nr:hypothetical protein TNCT_291751 [Trichonephila clavata]